MNLIKNKGFILLLFILNLIGVFASGYTYVYDASYYFSIGNYIIIPFFMVSFWLFLFAAIITFYLYKGYKIPDFLLGFSFAYCFVYGFGSVIFYPLFMEFVRGLTLYHFWNIFAHGFVGLQSLIFLSVIRERKLDYRIGIFFIFLLKDIMDLFFGGFLYFVKFRFPFALKLGIILVIVLLQIMSICLLSRRCGRLK